MTQQPEHTPLRSLEEINKDIEGLTELANHPNLMLTGVSKKAYKLLLEQQQHVNSLADNLLTKHQSTEKS